MAGDEGGYGRVYSRIFATASMPFFDDNTPRNREYEDPTIIV